ncbi:MAG: hypothetical protein SVY53_05850 [Chloroflexota bacterium]|nr:hypothetical protein [Chloroflexota bacterium]
MNRRSFLTDSEFESIAGVEAIKLIHDLGKYAEPICKACGGKCCREIGCGFYSPKFEFCPVFDLRPAKCRFYHCRAVTESETLDPETRNALNKNARRLSDIIEADLLELVFSDPPTKPGPKRWLTGLAIEEKAHNIVQAFEMGKIAQHTAVNQLRALANECR